MNNFSLLGKGGEKNDCLFLLPDRPIGIGTDPDKCSIIYSQDKNNISDFHCQLVPKKDGWTLADYSDKGTWLNGKKMNPYQAYPLKPGDVFYLASLENSFYFSIENANNSPQNPDQPQNLQWSPQNPDQTQNPQWTPQNPGQTQNPQWSPQNPGQTQNPQWSPQNPGQTRNPQWSPQNPGQPQNQELGVKEKFLAYKGRLDRKTYIIRGFYLSALNAIIWFIMGIILTFLWKSFSDITLVVVVLLPVLVMLIPGIMLNIRRLHDLDKSGWYNLLSIIPIVNFYVLYMLLVKEGTHGANRFGAEYHYQAPVNLSQREFEEKYLTFDGRLNRKPYALRLLCLLGSAIGIGLLAVLILSLIGSNNNDTQIITQIVLIPFTYSFPLLTIRRLHDLDKSGWFYLVMLVPLINLIFLIYLLFVKGTGGTNRFGSDPLI